MEVSKNLPKHDITTSEYEIRSTNMSCTQTLTGKIKHTISHYTKIKMFVKLFNTNMLCINNIIFPYKFVIILIILNIVQ
jgi:hypothetical protein